MQPVAQKLNDVNSEFANWTIQDADKFFVAPSGKRVVKAPNLGRAKVSEGEQILAFDAGRRSGRSVRLAIVDAGETGDVNRRVRGRDRDGGVAALCAIYMLITRVS